MKRILFIFSLCVCSALLGGYLASKQDTKQLEQCLTYCLAFNSSSETKSEVAALLKIQRGDIAGATELLEKLLDTNLQSLSSVAPKMEHNYFNNMGNIDCGEAIKIAKYYRACYKSHNILT